MVRQINIFTFDKQLRVENATQIDALTNFIFSKTLSVNAAYVEKFNVICKYKFNLVYGVSFDAVLIYKNQ